MNSGRDVWRRELVRKLVHVGMVVLPAWIWWSPPAWRSHGLLLAVLLALCIDLLRRVWKPWAHWIDTKASAYARPRESRLWFGVHAMFLAAWILSWSVSPQTAVVSCCYGIFGDAAAALVGLRRRAPTARPTKSVRGSAACFVTCIAVGLLWMPGEASRIVVGALAATLLERFSGPIDDNLTMPLGAAIVLALVA
jgi:dolichol kinase